MVCQGSLQPSFRGLSVCFLYSCWSVPSMYALPIGYPTKKSPQQGGLFLIRLLESRIRASSLLPYLVIKRTGHLNLSSGLPLFSLSLWMPAVKTMGTFQSKKRRGCLNTQFPFLKPAPRMHCFCHWVLPNLNRVTHCINSL